MRLLNISQQSGRLPIYYSILRIYLNMAVNKAWNWLKSECVMEGQQITKVVTNDAGTYVLAKENLQNAHLKHFTVCGGRIANLTTATDKVIITN